MLSGIQIKQYRGFQDFRMERLGQVNLLVGRNNCGKTSLLEAVHLYAAGGDPFVLTSAAYRRGEYRLPQPSDRMPFPVIDVGHFFYGHVAEEGSHIEINLDNGWPPLEIRVTTREQDQEGELFGDDIRPPSLLLTISGGMGYRGKPRGPIMLTTRGLLLEDPRTGRFVRDMWRESEELSPVLFIAPDSIEPRRLGGLWNHILTEGREDDVVRAMRILDSRIGSIAFLVEDAERSPNRGPSIIVGIDKQRVPLGSLGDGMRRLLAISSALIRCEKGVLMIDEIDTGLHHSVMRDMWRLVVGAAATSGTQVFATTHSLDCLRALADLSSESPEFSKAVMVHRIEPDSESSVSFSGTDLPIAIEHEIEIR